MGSLDQQNPSQLHLNILIMQAFIVVLSLASVAFADHAPAYGHHAPAYGPQIHCRDTNTSVYAEVSVPQHTDTMPQHTVPKSTAGIPTPLSTLRSACPLSPPKPPPSPWLLRK